MNENSSGTQIAMSTPAVGEGGRTGDWRNKHPELDAATCSAAKQGRESCQLCWVYCPDACITRGAPPTIDLTYCKGCGICSQECPTGSIVMIAETESGACEIGAAASAER
jgi:pyruvate ferredoxin oxidoreductase delta subunit